MKTFIKVGSSSATDDDSRCLPDASALNTVHMIPVPSGFWPIMMYGIPLPVGALNYRSARCMKTWIQEEGALKRSRQSKWLKSKLNHISHVSSILQTMEAYDHHRCVLSWYSATLWVTRNHKTSGKVGHFYWKGFGLLWLSQGSRSFGWINNTNYVFGPQGEAKVAQGFLLEALWVQPTCTIRKPKDGQEVGRKAKQREGRGRTYSY
jgi:hypothetical protein